MVLVAIALLCGQLVGPEAEVPLHVGALAAALVLALAGAAAGLRFEPATRAIAAAIAGAFLCGPAEPPVPDCWLPPGGGPVKRWIIGTVAEPYVPVPGAHHLWLDARIEGAERRPVCGRLRLSLREAPSAGPAVGDRIRIHGTLRRPRDFANPGAFASVESLARRGTWVVGGAARITSIAAPNGATAARRLDRLRRRIRAAIERAADGPAAELLRAVVLGEARAVDPATRETFAASGLAHLLAVSGLHVGAVWGVTAFALLRLLGRSERLLLSSDPRALAAVLATLPALLYATLAGGSLPTERAVAFVALGAFAAAIGRETKPARLLAIAALAISFAHPGAVRSISFQLSFAAVTGLLLAAPSPAPRPLSPRERIARVAVTALRLSFAASVATAPLIAFHFQRVSPIGLATNPLLVPTLGVPATLLGLAGAALAIPWPAAGEGVLVIAAAGFRVLVRAAELSLLVPGAALRVPMPSGLELAILYGALGLRWAPPHGRRRLALLIAIVAAGDGAYWIHERSGTGGLRVRFLDVGQGDAALLELPDGRVVVIDGGGMPGPFDVGERVVAPALRARKISRIDVLVATHGDRDHQGGLHVLVRDFAPRELWLPDAPEEGRRLAGLAAAASMRGARIRRLAAGDRIADASSVEIDCLHPAPGVPASPNDRSLVLRIRHGATSFLFPGDVEHPAERRLLGGGELETVDLWKVPHHGSGSSSDAALLAVLRPRIAIVSAGAGNPYGMPHPDVLRRHRRIGARVLRTDVDGSILVVGDGRSLVVRAHDRAARRACSATGALC